MRRLAAAAVSLVLVTGCSSHGSPAADLQTRINAVADAANAKDAATLRTAVGELLQEVQQQSANGDITSTKAQDLRTVGTRLLREASIFDTTAPAPAPSAADTPAAEPSPSPSPRRRYSPPPSPTGAPSPNVVPSIGLSSSPEPSATP